MPQPDTRVWLGMETAMRNWFSNTSVGFKVALAPCFAVLCLLVVGIMGLIANNKIGDSLTLLGENRLPKVISAADLDNHLHKLHIKVNQSLAWEGAGFKAEKIAELDKSILNDLETYGKKLNAAAENPQWAEDEKALLANINDTYLKYQKIVKDMLELKSGMLANAASFVTTMDSSFSSLSKTFSDLITLEQTKANAAVADGQGLVIANKMVIIIGFALSVFLTMAFALFCVRKIVGPLHQASQIAHAVAQGNLTNRAEDCSTDATGQVLLASSEVSTSLSNIVEEIRNSAQLVDHASEEIAASNADLSSRTEHAASSLQQTAASLEQLTATIKHNSENAGQASQLAQAATAVAQEGGNAVTEVIRTMNTIDTQSGRIGEIISVIDGIAFQTNILALNAAVEAARAGEQGRGFAVVAQEVRTLASRSGAAAKEIRELIGESIAQVQTGTQKVNIAGEKMQRIVESITKVSSMIEEIARASSEQSSGILQINEAISSMDRNTQHNAALVEEAAATAESLKQQARNLVQAMQRFRTSH